MEVVSRGRVWVMSVLAASVLKINKLLDIKFVYDLGWRGFHPSLRKKNKEKVPGKDSASVKMVW